MDSTNQQFTAPVENKLHFLDYWRIIRIRKALIITVFLITAIIATAVTFILPESYSSTARIKVERDSSDVAGFTASDTGVSLAPYDPYFIQTTFEIMQSEVVLSNVVAAMNLNVEWGKKFFDGEPLKTTETMEILKNRMQLMPVRNTKLISITFYSDDKNEAAKLANTEAECYRDYRQNQLKEHTEKALDVLQKGYVDQEAVIAAVHTNVNYLQQKYKIFGVNPGDTKPQSTMTAEQLSKYDGMRIDGEKNYKELLSQLDQLKSMPKNQLRDVLPQINPDGELSGLLSKLHESEQEYVKATNYYALKNLEVTSIQSIIDKLNEQIDARVTGIMASMEAKVSSTKASLDELVRLVEEAKDRDNNEMTMSQPYWDEKAKLERLETMHTLLYTKIESERLDVSIPKTQMVSIIDFAEPGKRPVKPNKTLNIALGLVFGLVMGVGLAFFIEYLDTSVKTIDDVERTFGAPVLGVIPQNIGYLAQEGPESKHAEAYRVLRTNVLFSCKDDKMNSIVVVSAGAGEGKSTTAVNLATVFAQAGQRVLIVDSDLRRPTLHKILNVSNNIGLTNYLLKQNSLAEVVQTTNVPMLDFMASGRLPNSSMGILGSAQMKGLISELKQRYDFVVFDSPPILGVSDASILASEVDLVIQVIQYRRYPQPMNIRAKQMIEKVGGNYVGIVLNNINMAQDESYYYYSGYYHNYYYTTNEGDQEAAARDPKTPRPEDRPAA